jgi:hypothetical protein
MILRAGDIAPSRRANILRQSFDRRGRDESALISEIPLNRVVAAATENAPQGEHRGFICYFAGAARY